MNHLAPKGEGSWHHDSATYPRRKRSETSRRLVVHGPERSPLASKVPIVTLLLTVTTDDHNNFSLLNSSIFSVSISIYPLRTAYVYRLSRSPHTPDVSLYERRLLSIEISRQLATGF
jgi:hypothetical protein